MTVFEMAKRYYPRLWGTERIDALVAAGRLTEAERALIIPAVSDSDTSGADSGGGGQDAE
ncbi:hypothetical protein [Vermiculatibacterium agrestimuris]|uniref:hypothetical protein n=1 Tax=Vermiculatibacterium agrestimuris TaxID=2941519 RepID=UPI00203BD9CA|nr:hypothetical protein [Vermiculatibacterium agrestimuris]